MGFRQIDVFGRRLSNVMADPSSVEPDLHDRALVAYLQLGGNCIHIHEEGGERNGCRATGQWLNRNGLRANFFLCTQICHTGWDEAARRPIDRFTPEAIGDDIDAGLESLATEYLDLVYLDDNPQAPLEPVLEAIGREIAGRRVRAFGVRNWTAERIHATPGIAAMVTTELALSAATAPLWPEYVPFDRELRQAVDAIRLPVIAQAADVNLGQCLYGDADATARFRPHWVQRWDHQANPALIARVRRFAEARRLTAREVNVAWLLNQSFPGIAVVTLASLLTARGTEYERASQLVLEEADRDLLNGSAAAG